MRSPDLNNKASADLGRLTSAVFTPSNSVWQIPLVGLSNTITDPWGVNITTDNKTSPYTIAVSNAKPSTLNNGSEIQPGLLTIGDDSVKANTLELGADTSKKEITVGNNSHLNISTSSDSVGNTSTPTVPFGLNLGYQGTWNGSLVLGGDYDANRVTTGVWNLLNESANGNSTFLTSGQQTLSTVHLKFRSINTSTEADETYSAVINLNDDAITLPSQAGIGICAAGFSIVLNTISGATKKAGNVTIDFPSNLTTSSGRCTTDNETSSNTITLGRPFFQAAYIYTDKQGQLWVNPAHQHNFPPKSLKFDSTQSLHTSTSPSSGPSGPGDWNKHTQRILLGTLGALFAVFMILTIILCLLHDRRRKQKQRKQAQQEMNKLHIQVVRDKIDEDVISLDEPSRRPPLAHMEPVSVFESDDESGPTVLKRTKTFLRGLKGGRKERDIGERDPSFDKRVVVEGGRVSYRDSGNDGFEESSWGHDHTMPQARNSASDDGFEEVQWSSTHTSPTPQARYSGDVGFEEASAWGHSHTVPQGGGVGYGDYRGRQF